MFAGSTRSLCRAAVAIALVAAFGAAAASTAQAAAPPKRIYACVTKRFNTLNLTTRTATCPKGQMKLSWSRARRGRAPRAPRATPALRAARAIRALRALPASRARPARAAPPTQPADVLAKLLRWTATAPAWTPTSSAGSRTPPTSSASPGTCAAGSWVSAVAADGTVTCNGRGRAAHADPGRHRPTRAHRRHHQRRLGRSARSASTTHGVGPGVFASTPRERPLGRPSVGQLRRGDRRQQLGRGRRGAAERRRLRLNIGDCNGIGAVVGRHDGAGRLRRARVRDRSRRRDRRARAGRHLRRHRHRRPRRERQRREQRQRARGRDQRQRLGPVRPGRYDGPAATFNGGVRSTAT